MSEENTTPNACIDQPDERDYIYTPLLGAGLSPVHGGSILKVWNQGAQHVTRMACTRFGLVHIINRQRMNQGEESISPVEMWKRYLKKNPQAENEGATLQSALKQAKDEGFIQGYLRITTYRDLEDAIAKGWYVYTGSNNGDWATTKHTRNYTIKHTPTTGHAFALMRKDQLLNSYGPDNGYFSFARELFDSTYSKYAIIPTTKNNILLQHKNRIMKNINLESAKKAFEAGIWNGEKPQEVPTREETAAMIYRMYEQLKNNTPKK